jgi:hypothetical protein
MALPTQNKFEKGLEFLSLCLRTVENTETAISHRDTEPLNSPQELLEGLDLLWLKLVFTLALRDVKVYPNLGTKGLEMLTGAKQHLYPNNRIEAVFSASGQFPLFVLIIVIQQHPMDRYLIFGCIQALTEARLEIFLTYLKDLIDVVPSHIKACYTNQGDGNQSMFPLLPVILHR